MSFFSFLESRTLSVDSLLCIGLDPHLEDLSIPNAEAAYDFCMRLIDATMTYASAYKPNMAFFEVFGADGMIVLKRIVDAIPDEIPVILDAKRGDIASTAQAYAKAAFMVINADAITLNPYLGYDAVEPFLNDPERGVFLLCKTSNPGASDLQDLITLNPEDISRKLTVFEHVASMAVNWNKHGNLGLVVASTQPDSLARVRDIAPEMWFLAPGVGAQGGNLRSALKAGLRKDKSGMLIPISRGISRADDPGKAADSLRKSINELRQLNYRRRSQRKIDEEDKFRLADLLLEKGCIRFAEEDNQFVLKSGMKSPIYIDLRRLVAFPDLVRATGAAYLPILSHIDFDRLAAIPYAAIPIATAISMAGNWPMIYPRKEAKQYGTKAEIEGEYFPDERVVVIDDLATTGGSKFEAIDKLTDFGLVVKDIVVLIDRQSGAADALANRGYQLHAVFTLSELLDHWGAAGTLTRGQIKLVREFLNTQSS
jgi:uridine monophosphate synthetase